MSERTFCKGYTWGFFSREGEYLTDGAYESMKRLASNGLDWICIVVNGWQENYCSTRIFSLYGRTQSDEEVVHAINMAHDMGLKVCLKPMVNCLDGVWRARIDFPDDGDYKDEWFKSYTTFMRHYAVMAERLGCEMLCTGCEMAGMDKNSERCRTMISSVREVYSGLIMHNINHDDETRFDWLDAVDIIGISGYYRLTTPDDLSKDAMRRSWSRVVEKLTECYEKYNRPVMFAEIGVRNERGCSMYPWDFAYRYDVPMDEQEQSDFYETAMEATWDIPWFAGYFWWDWKAYLPPEEEMKQDREFTIYGKLAEKTLREWYTKR